MTRPAADVDGGYVVGVDVGTGSARAAVFSASGVLMARGEHPIDVWHPRPDHIEQSSDDIWLAATAAVRDALRGSGATPSEVRGIGFDATCSLVAIDAAGAPVAVNSDGDDHRTVVVWMDHRAVDDAEQINRLGHPVLASVGGRISPEMQTPKLRWLQRELPAPWARVAHWFDLPDFLTWRATGALSRSLCSTVCKWTYVGHEGRWDRSFFEQIGLGGLADGNFSRIGNQIHAPGTAVGSGLSADAAADLGLLPGTPVGTSIIDAHAGALGAPATSHLDRRLAIIAGTSACHLAVSSAPLPVPGVWGPYWSALLPGWWLAEGGISASGAAIDHIVANHPASRLLGPQPLAALEQRLDELADGSPERLTRLAHAVHVDPSLLGNRSPLADPTRTGALVGWSLRDDLDDLAVRYLAAVQGLAYATRHIVEAMTEAGWRFEVSAVTGGSTHSPLWLRTHADVLDMPVVVPAEPDAVLLGAAMLGAVAGGLHSGVKDAMASMTRPGTIIEPNRASAEFHRAKYGVYRRMLRDHDNYRAAMEAARGEDWA